MSASAGLSAAKRRRGGVQTRPSNVGVNGHSQSPPVSRDLSEPIDVRSLVLQHDYKLYQIEQALAHVSHQLDALHKSQELAATTNNVTLNTSEVNEETQAIRKDLDELAKFRMDIMAFKSTTNGEIALVKQMINELKTESEH